MKRPTYSRLLLIMGAGVLSACVQAPVHEPAHVPAQDAQFATPALAPVVRTLADDIRAARADPILPSQPERCAGLNAQTDQMAAAYLALDTKVLLKIRAAAKADNETLCKMSLDERDALITLQRKRKRSPDEKPLRPAAIEWVRLWDAGDDGRQPDSSQVLAADAGRRALMGIVTGTDSSGSKGPSQSARLTGAGVTSTTWIALGPSNVGGRIRSVLTDPRDPNRLLVGSVTGGIWLTTNAGQSYAPVVDTMANIAIGSMAITPTNPDVLYAGTGESFQGFSGIGMYKSVDAGLTWTFLNNTSTNISADWVYTNRIAVNNANASIVIAANNGGLYRSTDAGATWTRVFPTLPTPVSMLDVKFNPNNPANAVASGRDGYMYFSNDTGQSWTRTGQLMAPGGSGNSARAEIAYVPTVANQVLICLDHNDGEIWTSADAGQTWTYLSNPKHLNGQGNYDNAIWIDPTNASNVLIGGLDLYRSQDGGVTFTRISTWQSAGEGLAQPHADHHVIVPAANYSAGNPVVYFGNDGGLYRSSNYTQASATQNTYWENLNNGLAITQFYGGAGLRAAGGLIIGGAQDNGSLAQFSGTLWERFAGGDGGFVAVDPVNDNTIYGEYVYAAIRRTVGSSGRYICNGITEGKKDTSTITYCGPNATEQTNFISPFVLDPNNRNRMLVGANSLWVTNDIQDTPPIWSVIKVPTASGTTNSHYISAVAVHAHDGNIIWVGYNTSGQIWKTSNGLSASPTWTQVDSPSMPANTINRLTIDQDNPNHVWAALSGFAASRLWETNDGGITWHSITANLPAVSLYDIKRHPSQANWLYVAAANGVYTSENGGLTWSTGNDGPSGVRVRELFWYDNRTLIAATFGRGMFQAIANPPAGPLAKRGGIDIDGQNKGQLILRSPASLMLAGRLVNGAFAFSAINDPGSTYKVTATGDLDGSGKSDLVFQTLATDAQGRVTVNAWLDFAVANQTTLRAVNPAWVIQASADLDGDGYGDLVFRFTGDDGVPNDTGVSYVWFQKAGGAYDVVRKRGGAPLDWKIVGAADLNGDGAADMVYLSPAGQLKALMATPGRTCANLNAGTVPAGFSALHMADYTGNRRGDILIRDATGVTKLLSLNGSGLSLPPYTGNPDDINASCTSSSLTVANTTVNLPASDPTWTYFASGDFDGDGIFDIVWKQPNGTLTVWLMQPNGIAPTVISNAGSVPAGGYLPIPLQ